MPYINLRVTLDRHGLTDYYNPTFPVFSVYIGQRVQFDDYWDELVVKLPSGRTAKVRMTKAEMETFTEYV